MTTKPTGGYVFPFQPLDRQGMPIAEMQPGITRRDWLAGMALQGVLANPAHNMRFNPEGDAQYCYAIADAMIAASEAEAEGEK